nr:MAG TPA: tail completion protein [Caudoviricetes sp.]
MLNEIVNGIGLKLSKSFNGINIHKEELEQGFEEPCFFIDLLNPSEKQIIGNRYLRSYLFDIVYFPKKKSSEEIFEVLDKLYSVLEYIELDDGTLIRGIERSSREEDRILHFFITYEMFIYKLDEEKPKMKKLDVNNGLKED